MTSARDIDEDEIRLENGWVALSYDEGTRWIVYEPRRGAIGPRQSQWIKHDREFTNALAARVYAMNKGKTPTCAVEVTDVDD